ncbi:MAG: amidohydrolase family protein [Gemmatimonadaceae bacterium]
MPSYFVDSHVHFWDPSVLKYPWLDGLPNLNAPFLPADYPPFNSRASSAAIFVEANVAPEMADREVAWVSQLATCEPRIRGIVGFVDLLADRSRPAALARLRATRRVVGVRHNIQGQPSGFAVQATFVRGVQEAGQLGLVFDLCVTANQLQEATELVRQCPNTTFVLDHCGKPAIRDGHFASWAEDLRRLAQYENVSCKLSGLLTEAEAGQCTFEVLQPYATHALACFGPSRLLYGSDWPVCTLRGGESQWWALMDQFTATFPSNARDDFYAGNAARIYGITFDPND